MLQRIHYHLKKRKGFDLIQVGLYAVAIAILMTVVITNFSGDFLDGNRRAVAKEEVKIIANAAALFEMYRAPGAAGTKPTSIANLLAGLTAEESVDGVEHNGFLAGSKWNAAADVKDPWGVAYTLDAATGVVEDGSGKGVSITYK